MSTTTNGPETSRSGALVLALALLAPGLLALVLLPLGCTGTGADGPSGDIQVGGAGDTSALCQSLCDVYLPCVDDSADPFLRTPLFCGVDDGSRAAVCQQMCQSAISGLGESRDDFISCAQCALPEVGDQVCDWSMTEDVAQVACSASCDSLAVGRASDVFVDSFSSDVRALDESHCEPGTHAVAADDPSVDHELGHAGAEGTWRCDNPSDCVGDSIVIGPPFVLAAGDYTLGVSGIVATGAMSDFAAELRVARIRGDTQSREWDVTAQELESGTVAGDIQVASRSTVRVELELSNVTSAVIGSVFVTRH